MSSSLFFSIVSIIFLGFFCPEMITQGAYYGDKSDVLSIGGIMLELILVKFIMFIILFFHVIIDQLLSILLLLLL